MLTRKYHVLNTSKDISIRFTRTNPHPIVEKVGNTDWATSFEYQVYRTLAEIATPELTYLDVTVSGPVTVEVFGIRMTRIMRNGGTLTRSETRDMGPISIHLYKVTALVHLLCRAPRSSWDIEQMIATELEDLHKNEWGSPFGKAAENKLKEIARDKARAAKFAHNSTSACVSAGTQLTERIVIGPNNTLVSRYMKPAEGGRL